MKVLQVINSLDPGGAEKLLVQLIPLLQQEGLEVDLLLLGNGEHKFLKLLEDQPHGKIMKNGSMSAYNPLHILRLRRLFKVYDLVHVHLFPALYWCAFAHIIRANPPKMVFTEHNSTNRRRHHWLLRHIDRIAYARFDKVVTISDDVDTNLKNHLSGFSEDRFFMINNGVDLNTIQNAKCKERASLGLSDADSVLLQVSSFTSQKDQACLIRALGKMNTKAQLLLVGEGPSMLNCRRLAEELELENRVHFLGLRMDVPALLKTADVVVLSSNFEGLSLASIEGLASGAPFVASRAPGLTEVVEGAGVLFETGNYRMLASEIDRLLRDTSHRDNVVASCLARAKEYDIQKMKAQHLNLYASLCP